MTPGVAELVGLPALIHSQQCEVIPLRLKELGALLIRLQANTSKGRYKQWQAAEKVSTLLQSRLLTTIGISAALQL
jgi:hypothetical protein